MLKFGSVLVFLFIFSVFVVSACVGTNGVSVSSCEDECPNEGYVECQGDVVATCGNFDNDECLEYQLDDCSSKRGPAGNGFCSDGECRFAGATITLPPDIS